MPPSTKGTEGFHCEVELLGAKTRASFGIKFGFCTSSLVIFLIVPSENSR